MTTVTRRRGEFDLFAAELRNSRQRIQVPPGQAVVLLVVDRDEQTAHLLASLHSARSPLIVPAARIAQQGGLPVSELPGRRFTQRPMGRSPKRHKRKPHRPQLTTLRCGAHSPG